MSTGKIELSVGAVKYVDPNDMITEEEYNYIKNKVPELDERVGVIEDEIEEINSSLENITTVFMKKSGESNNDALERIFKSMPNGGFIKFPKGVIELEPFIVPSRIKIEGAGQDVTILKLKDKSNQDFITFDQSAYSGITKCTIDGNKLNNTKGSGIVIKNSQVEGKDNSRNLLIEDICIQNCKENGIYVKKPYVWIFQLRFIKINECDGYGILNEGTDNSFYCIDIYKCKKGGIFESGFNNRWVGGKIYCNGEESKDSGGIIISSSARVIMSDFEIQESYGNGLLVKDSNEISLSSILSDCNGDYGILYEDPSLYGCAFKFINSRDITLLGGIATSTQVTKQQYGLYIEGACSNIKYAINRHSRYYKDVILSDNNIVNIGDNSFSKKEIGVPKNISKPLYKINYSNTTPIYYSSVINGLKIGANTRFELPTNIVKPSCWSLDFEIELLGIPTSEKMLGQIYDNTTNRMYRIAIINQDSNTFSIKVYTPGGSTTISNCTLNQSYRLNIVKTGRVCRVYVNNEFIELINIYSDITVASEFGFYGNVEYIIKNLKYSHNIYGFENGIDNFTQIYMPLQNDFSYGLGLDYRCQTDKIILKSPNGSEYSITIDDSGVISASKI